MVKDHLGSPRLLVDVATGAVAQKLDYDAWGAVMVTPGTEGLQPFGFAGGLWDPDTGLVRFGARDYDPATGRWTSKDASRFAGGANFYAYAENDPVNYIDPTGYFAVFALPDFVALAGEEALGGSSALGGAAEAGLPVAVAGAGVAFIGYAAWDIAHQIDDYRHPTVTSGLSPVLESKKWDNREGDGDGTRGLTPDEIRDKHKNPGWSDGRINKLINEIDKIRENRNKRKRGKEPFGSAPCP